MKTVPEHVKRELATRFSADPGSLAFLGGGQDWSDGTLFTFLPVSMSEPMVLKILAFPDTDVEARARAEERLKLFGLFGDRGARIVRPVPSRSGSLFETFADGRLLYLAYAYRKARGRPAVAHDICVKNGSLFTAVGGVLGKLHAVSCEYPETLGADGLSDRATTLKGWREEWAFFRSWCRDPEVGLAWEHVRDALTRLPVEKTGYGFVHNDAHVWNMLYDPEATDATTEPALTVIDFDCSGYHWFANDSAVALYSIIALVTGGIEPAAGPPGGFRDRAFGAFWEGYRRHREPGESWLRRTDLFLQYRRCLMFMPFQEVTARDAAWRKRWKDRILAEDARLFR